jgi:lambda repressor-like predicted transcriptional regulator
VAKYRGRTAVHISWLKSERKVAKTIPTTERVIQEWPPRGEEESPEENVTIT